MDFAILTGEVERESSSATMTTTAPGKNQRIQVPDSLRDVLLEFSIAYLSEQPKDVVDYAVEFFTKLQEKRNHSNNMVSVEINSPDESILSQEDGESKHTNFSLIGYLWVGSTERVVGIMGD